MRPNFSRSLGQTLFAALLFAACAAPRRAQALLHSTGLAGQVTGQLTVQEPAARPGQTLPALWQSVVVLGASVSDGCGLKSELGFSPKFADFLKSGLPPEAQLHSESDLMFFASPIERGAKLFRNTQGYEPSLVIALDFLFWYAHGNIAPERRRSRLREGLALLGQLKCPLVISDLPDIRIALQGVGPLGMPVISPSMLPDTDLLAELNQTIAEWVAERDSVSLVPMGQLLSKALDPKKPLQQGGQTWPADSLSVLMQPDLLHPTKTGNLALTSLVLESLQQQLLPADSEHRLEVSFAALERNFEVLTTDQRQRAEERQARRLERKRKREAKQAAK